MSLLKSQNAANRSNAIRWLSKAVIYLSIVAIVFAGPLVFPLPTDPMMLHATSTGFGTFLLIILFWEFLLRFISKYVLKGSRKSAKLKKLLFIALAFIFSSTLLYLAGHLEDKITHEYFAVLLGLLAVRGIAQGLALVGYDRLWFLALSTYLLGLSSFSGILSMSAWDWAFISIAVSLQSGIYSQYFLQKIWLKFDSSDEQQSEDISVEVLCRLHAISLLMGPLIICFLQYLGYFPKSYLVCLLALTFMLRAAEYSKRIENQKYEDLISAQQIVGKIQIASDLSSLTFLFCFALAPYLNF